MGEIHLLIKKAKLQPNTSEWSDVSRDDIQREMCVLVFEKMSCSVVWWYGSRHYLIFSQMAAQ